MSNGLAAIFLRFIMASFLLKFRLLVVLASGLLITVIVSGVIVGVSATWQRHSTNVLRQYNAIRALQGQAIANIDTEHYPQLKISTLVAIDELERMTADNPVQIQNTRAIREASGERFVALENKINNSESVLKVTAAFFEFAEAELLLESRRSDILLLALKIIGVVLGILLPVTIYQANKSIKILLKHVEALKSSKPTNGLRRAIREAVQDLTGEDINKLMDS